MKKENAHSGAQSVLSSAEQYSTTSQHEIFNSSQFGDLTVITGSDSKPMFIATEVANALGYKNPHDAINKHCKKAVLANHENSRQAGKIIPESDLYRLIMKSTLPTAEAFQDWVCEVILPSIHRNGGYIQGQEELSSSELLAKAVLVANETIAERELENKRLNGVLVDLTQQFATGVTIPVFCMQLNGVNTQQVQSALARMGVLIRERHGYRPASPHRNKHFKFSSYPYAPGKERYTTTVTQGGATFLYKLYHNGKLPMLKDWDGCYTTSQLTKEQLAHQH
ncbi:hypothetical protein I6Y99_004192 [Vibrio parahaemolyticus]|nr:hypothetical protein [Vibrio parahaemolyticus]